MAATVFKKVKNNAGSTLAANVLAGDTSFAVQAGDGVLFPATSGGATYWVTLNKADGSAYEVVLVTALATDTFTVTRAQQGTSALGWSSGDRVDLFSTAQLFDDITGAINTLETATPSGSSSVNLAITTAGIYDEFLSGTTSSGSLGALGWTLGAGTVSFPAVNANHPGLLQLSTTTTAPTLARMYTAAGFDPSLTFDLMFILRLDVLDAETMVRVGLCDVPSNNPPNGLFVERLVADTNDFFPVARFASAQTRGTFLPTTGSASSPAVATATFYRIRIRRIDSTHIGFSIDGQTEQSLSTNIPTSGMAPFIQLQYNTGGTLGAKTLAVDAFGLAPMTVVR